MQIFEGIVVSNKMKNTAVVEVERRTPHPLYKKLIKRGKKYKVEVGDFNVLPGERVKIVQTRPLSKDKNFKVLEVLNKKGETTQTQKERKEK